MSEIRLRDGGSVLSESDYKALHPRVSFPPGFAPADADRVADAAPPAVTIYQRAVRAGVEQVGGQWRQAWTTAPALVPESVPMLNARLVLIEGGHMAAVNAHLASMTGTAGEQARTFFEFAQNVRRDHWVVEGLRQVLGLTPGQIDNLFILAPTLD